MDIDTSLPSRGTYVRVHEGRVMSSRLDTDARVVIYSSHQEYHKLARLLAFEVVPGYAPDMDVIMKVFEMTPCECDELARAWPLVTRHV